jgi:ketosteroid isomerase-like protein
VAESARRARGHATDAVLAANAGFYTAIETADLDLMESLWLPGAETVCVHPGSEPLRGTPAILRSWTVVMANLPYVQFFLTDVAVSVRGDVASVYCTENVLSAPDDDAVEAFAGGRSVATNVFVRTASGAGAVWRLWAHHSSPVLDGSGER